MSSAAVKTLVDKLIDLSLSNTTLVNIDFNSPKIAYKKTQLKKILPNSTFSESALTTLAIYFQSINLNKFSKEELYILLNIDYKFLENNSTNLTLSRNTFNLKNPPIDLGDSTILNSEVSSVDITNTHTKLLSVNKNRSLNFFLNYILSRL